jgi:uncharacterized membrane protein
MSDPSRSVEEYLTRLGDALDVLGKDGAAEIVAEIRGHLGDAISERDGNAEEVLAEFGTPDALATRILEERGILAGSPSLAAAPKTARLVALLLDIAVWLFAVCAVYVALQVAITLKFITDLHILAVLGIYAVEAAMIGASIWWWARGRGRAGHSTVGMRLVGLRRVRIGQKVITARLADIPGASRPNRLLPALMIGLALLVVVPALLSAYGVLEANRQAERDAVVSEVSMAASVVGELYRKVENGATVNNLADISSPSARTGVSSLISRHAKGQLGGYVVSRLEVVSYSPENTATFNPPRAGAVLMEIVVRVHVLEYAKNSDERSPYVFQVRERTFSGGDSANDTTLVESIARDTEQ